MKKHNRWPLPDIDNPPRQLCAIVRVPYDRKHIAAFFGALYALAWQQNWERDPEERARDVAAVWQKIWDGIRFTPCGEEANDEMNFRQNGCKLEFSIDCINWATLYDPTACIREVVRATSGQQGAGGTVGPGQCKEFDIVVPANQVYRLPVPVSEGDTIEITEASGAWTDGGGQWNCADGTPYLLGSCVGLAGHVTGDPTETEAWHMQLIASIDGIFYPASGGTITIPGSTPLSAVDFYANDDDISNNSGSIALHVKICGAGGWCRTFDFTIDEQGFTIHNGAGTYEAGVGFHPSNVGGENSLYAGIDLTGAQVTEIEATCDVSLGSSNAINAWISEDFGPQHGVSLQTPVSGVETYTWTLDAHCTTVLLNLDGIGLTGTMTSLTMRGTGADPGVGTAC